MSESDKYTRIVGPDGEKLIVKKPSLIDLLPSPKDAAKEGTEDGLDDRRVNDPWVRGNR